MNLDFLFWIFLVGLIIATFQDLKRREVDDWLNLFLIVSSFTFVFLRVYFERNFELAYLLLFSLAVMFALMNAFYYARIFAGGDAKLLFAMTALFLGVSFTETMINIGTFAILLMLAGSVYGLLYSFYIYSRNFRAVNEGIRKEFGGGILYSFVAGFMLLILSFFSVYFIALTIFAFVFPFLYVFAKGLENASMIRTAVKIKEGMPFVPAFLLGFLLYVFLKDYLFRTIFGAL
jgi:Flp pilus assembly protein protease CpaA